MSIDSPSFSVSSLYSSSSSSFTLVDGSPALLISCYIFLVLSASVRFCSVLPVSAVNSVSSRFLSITPGWFT